MSGHNQAQKYQLIQIESSSPEGLVVLAYDALLRFIHAGKIHMKENEIEKTHEALKKAQIVIWELVSALKVEAWDGAMDLMRLYEFMLAQIRTANLEKNAEPLDRILPIAQQLRDAWQDAYKQMQAQKKRVTAVDSRG